jgi:hypothetical protein
VLLVVLGAGASYDSLEPLRLPDRHPDRPPLAAELFDDRDTFREVEVRYPEASALFPVLRQAGRAGSIEAEFDRLQSEAASSTTRARQLAALRFYIRQVIEAIQARWISNNRVTQLNHNALLEQLDFGRKGTDPILLVTFNYDTFIEQALSRANHRLETLSDFVDNSRFPLFKLHGSVDWSREVVIDGSVSREDVRGGAFDAAGLIKYASQWREIDYFVRAQTTFAEGRHFVPALAVPVQSKIDFQCPSQHVRALKSQLPDVDRILTIGWRGQEQHFLNFLKKGIREPVKVLCISGDQAKSEQTLERIRGSGLPMDTGGAPDMGFSDLVCTRAVESFLGA